MTEPDLRSPAGSGILPTQRPPRFSPRDFPALRDRITDADVGQRHREDTIVVEGARIGNYRLITPLGNGGMGKVWLALHLGLHRRVALKTLHREVHAIDDMRRRFEREAIAIGRLSHPGIVEAIDFAELGDGRKFLAMEYVEGLTLAEILKKDGPLDWRTAVRMAADVADALAFAHSRGVVHRDLKPDNLIFTGSDPTTSEVRILDLGLARVDDSGASSITEHNVAMGTANYSAPEQLRGAPADGRSDLYSLGAVLFSALTGEPPYPGVTLAEVVLSQHQRRPRSLRKVRPDSTRPPELDALVRACLATDPDARPESAAALRDQLRWLLRPARPAPRWRTVAFGAGLVSLGLVAGCLGALLLGA